MATFPLNSFAFTPRSDSATNTEVGSGSVTAISNSALVTALQGNDSIFGSGSSGSVDTDAGSDPRNFFIFGINNFRSGKIDMGTGNDSISGIATVSFSSPWGPIYGNGIENEGVIDMGAGNDSISGDAAADVPRFFGFGVSNSGKIYMGAGNDSISGNAAARYGSGVSNYNGEIYMGAGNDSISGTFALRGATASFGLNAVSNYNSKIDMGNGNDSISGTNLSAASFCIGVGNYNSEIDMGAGNDSVSGVAYGASSNTGISNYNSKINMGNGNDSISGTVNGSGYYNAGISNDSGKIDMGNGNDSISGAVTSADAGTLFAHGLYNKVGSKIDAGAGDDNLFFAVNIAGISQKVTIDGGGDIFMGLGKDSFTGFGNMTVYGDAGTGNDSNKDILDLSLFKSSDFTIEKIGTGANHAKFTYNDPVNPASPSIIMTTNEFDKFVFADKTVNYALLA